MSGVAAIIAPLFVPAHRPDRFGKAAAGNADGVILDLEDAVPADAKDAARDGLAIGFSHEPVIVRRKQARSILQRCVPAGDRR